MFNSFSQTNQDLFVSLIMKQKINGHFLEIGSGPPIANNNTFKLEKDYNWKGIMIEYLQEYENLYKIHRPNSVYYINDARKINYLEVLEQNNLFNINIYI